jgi:hypothetical protein
VVLGPVTGVSDGALQRRQGRCVPVGNGVLDRGHQLLAHLGERPDLHLWLGIVFGRAVELVVTARRLAEEADSGADIAGVG